MRRTMPAAMIILLSLAASLAPSAAASAAPDAAASAAPDAATSPDPGELVRTEAPHVGLAIAFPADWRVSVAEYLERQSALTTAEGEAIMETTAINANGPDAWCNVDVYLALDLPLQTHAYAYATRLAETAGTESSMVVLDHELPVGPSVRIEIFDPERGRSRSFFLFDGPAAADGTLNRFLLSCAAPADAGPFWVAFAESAEVFEPVEPAASAEALAPGASPEASPDVAA